MKVRIRTIDLDHIMEMDAVVEFKAPFLSQKEVGDAIRNHTLGENAGTDMRVVSWHDGVSEVAFVFYASDMAGGYVAGVAVSERSPAFVDPNKKKVMTLGEKQLMKVIFPDKEPK